VVRPHVRQHGAGTHERKHAFETPRKDPCHGG
jgi:hypothetical protein